MAGVCSGNGPCDTSSFGAGKNWVNKVGGLPAYIRAIAHSLQRDHGMTESRAISTAVATVKRWATGGGGVTAATRARAAKAVAEWESKKAASHVLTATPTYTVDLASPAKRAAADRETAAIRERAKTATFPHKFAPATWTHPNGHPRCKNCGQEERIGGMCTKPTDPPTAGPATAIPLTAQLAATVDLAFTEQLHPRGGKGTAAGGKFVAKNSGSGPPANMAANVRDFQRRTGLPVTGIIDAATAAKIQATAASKSGGSAKTKARHAAAVARKQISQHVTAVNALSPDQRAQYRAKVPTPPIGYVWGKNDTLHRAPNTTALRGVLATIGAKSVAAAPAATTTPRSGSGQRTAASLTRRRHH